MKNQWLFPPKPTFTEKDVPSQAGRVFIVTGGNSGVGFELCKMLYPTGAKLYMACRSKERAEKAIQAIKEAHPHVKDTSSLAFLPLDLNDLESVKAAAATFQKQETKLDVLWNNAGLGGLRVPPGFRTAQGFEPMVGIHLIATLLFTELLRPQLRDAAATSSPGAVRVIWLSSIAAEGSTPPNGLKFEELDEGTSDRLYNYAYSKSGSWFLAREMARRYAPDGIVSVALNPGNLKANSYEGMPWYGMMLMGPLLHHPKYGGYTELFAGLSPQITQENSGAYVIPWGRIQTDEQCGRKDIVKALKSTEEGGLGYPKRLWEWCEEKWKPYV
ncbi:NAD(P)-binding protein [Thozetella sp. PMI_491]|nr:NAD(P)-binding protein [Thozetella sp. PMI_491]